MSDLFPAEWAAPCPVDNRPLPTTQDIIDRGTEDRSTLRECDSRMGKVRDWRRRQAAQDGTQ